ncbi:MAG: hypothetical protein J7604_18775 [Sporocytophaga sp.]|nr:hypothetical protein [Sporocytophaga sp.]
MKGKKINMAIYQFYLVVIPRVGLLMKCGRIPERIIINTNSGYFESMTKEYWNLADVDSNKIVLEIDQLISRAQYGNNEIVHSWKYYAESLDIDAFMCLNQETSKIEELSFRTDLREENLYFLLNMLDLGKKYDWLFMDRNGILANPNIEEIIELIKKSNNYRFLKDPYKYIKGLNAGNNEKE